MEMKLPDMSDKDLIRLLKDLDGDSVSGAIYLIRECLVRLMETRYAEWRSDEY